MAEIVRPLFPSLIETSGKLKPPYGFTPNQQAQYDYITATEPNVWFWGNRGGGKSVTARWTCHARALSYPGYRYAILRTSFPELIKNHLIYLKAEMEALGGKYNASKFIVEYPNGSMGFYMQAETEEQTRNALGVEMMEVVFDEAPTFKWEHMMMIASSVRVPAGSGLTPLKRFNGNPIGPCIDDIWKYFIDKDVDLGEDPEYRPDEWRSIEIRMEDNVDLDVVAYKKQLGAGLPVHLRKAWLDGVRFDARMLFELKPTITVPTLDPAVTVEKPYHIIEELPRAIDANGNPADILTLPWVRIQGCYDDGFMDPAYMAWAVNIGQQIVVFNERVWTHTNSPDIAEGILDASVIVTEKGDLFQLPLKTIYADPVISKESTAVQSTQQVMQHVWKCMEHGNSKDKRCCDNARALRFEPSTNSRELFASAVNRLLQAEIAPNTPKVQFLKPNPLTAEGKSLITRGIVGCPYLIKYLPKMQADATDPRKMADHKHDHPVVAFAYLAMSYPITTAARVEEARPPWWNDFFIAGTNIPKAQKTLTRRRR
jgi:hypothetical protein